MANSTPPIPQDPIGENFKWRDWFQKLSDKVFGTLSEQNANSIAVTGGSLSGVVINNGTINNSSITGGTITNATLSGGTLDNVTLKGSYHLSSLTLTTPLAITSGGTGASTASGARSNLGLGSGLSVTITTAKLTAGGTNGSMTFTNGILTSQTQAT